VDWIEKKRSTRRAMSPSERREEKWKEGLAFLVLAVLVVSKLD
jgi:hypothetical protein